MRLELSSVSGPARVGRRATRRCLAALGVSPGRSRRISPHGTYCDTWLWVARPHTMSKRNTELGMGTNESGKAIHEVGGGGYIKRNGPTAWRSKSKSNFKSRLIYTYVIYSCCNVKKAIPTPHESRVWSQVITRDD